MIRRWLRRRTARIMAARAETAARTKGRVFGPDQPDDLDSLWAELFGEDRR